MPLYEYQCDSCGHRFELIQKFSDAPVEKCPKCGGAVRKLVSSPAFQFKGSGWYVTDYAKKPESSGSNAKPTGSAETAKDGRAAESKDTAAKESAKETKAASDKPASSGSSKE
jgi:putative FmdB family regulatory protein